MDGCHSMILAMSHQPLHYLTQHYSTFFPLLSSPLICHPNLFCPISPTILLLFSQERKRQAKESEKDAKESDSKNRVALDAASKVMQYNLISIIWKLTVHGREGGTIRVLDVPVYAVLRIAYLSIAYHGQCVCVCLNACGYVCASGYGDDMWIVLYCVMLCLRCHCIASPLHLHSTPCINCLALTMPLLHLYPFLCYTYTGTGTVTGMGTST